ncbi:MAG TPA: hypothetical protein ENI11_01450 [Actinobacteria bacterium]|nr:hypothetical protein [Actinomycetota bacterium]
MKKIGYAIGVLILVLGLTALTGCGQKTAPGKATKAKKVSIVDSTFKPADTPLLKNGKVTWLNDDSLQHTVTADDNGFNSGQLSEGEVFEYKFSKIGSFPYHCENHPEMKGSIVVEE